MVILNLFVGVIMNGMDESQAEQQQLEALRKAGDGSLDAELITLTNQLEALQAQVAKVRLMAERDTARTTG